MDTIGSLSGCSEMSTENQCEKQVGVRWCARIGAGALILALMFNGVSQAQTHGAPSEADLRQLREFADTADIDTYIGQLLIVGVPGDADRTDKLTEHLIQKLGVGGVMLNEYYYSPQSPDRRRRGQESLIEGAATWHSTLQEWAKKGVSKLPLFMAVDYESLDTDSFAGLVPNEPVPALTLAATHDNSLIALDGALVGTQLSLMGANMLFGPVLDLDASGSNIAPYALGARSFGEEPIAVIAAARSYIQGVRNAGVLSVVKHFPGLGSLGQVKLHEPQPFPSLQASPMQFVSGLEPFRQLAGEVDGVMTSHVEIRGMPNATSPVTYSSQLVEGLMRGTQGQIDLGDDLKVSPIGIVNQLVITDDLADMGPIVFDVKNRNRTFPEIATSAFRSGHDLLLFAHLEDPDSGAEHRSTSRLVTENVIELVRQELSLRVKEDQELQRRFRESFYRILLAKFLVAKHVAKDISVENFLRGKIPRSPYTPSVEALSAVIVDGKTHKADDLFADIFEKATVQLSTRSWQAKPLSLSGLGTDTKVCFIVDVDAEGAFRDGFPTQIDSGKWNLAAWPHLLAGQMDARKGELRGSLRECDRVLMTVSSIDQLNVLMDAFLYEQGRCADKLWVILKMPPSRLLELNAEDRGRLPKLFSQVVIAGNFTTHSNSHRSDVRLAKGDFLPAPPNHLPVRINGITGFGDAAAFDQPMTRPMRVEPDVAVTNVEQKERQLVDAKRELERVNEALAANKRTQEAVQWALRVLTSAVALYLAALWWIRKRVANWRAPIARAQLARLSWLAVTAMLPVILLELADSVSAESVAGAFFCAGLWACSAALVLSIVICRNEGKEVVPKLMNFLKGDFGGAPEVIEALQKEAVMVSGFMLLGIGYLVAYRMTKGDSIVSAICAFKLPLACTTT